MSIYALMAVGVVMGIAYTLFDVADNSAFPSLVTRKQLPRAASLAEGGATAADLLGPALAGVVISAFASVQAGVGGAYVINAFTFVVAAGFVAAIRRPLTPPARDTSAPSGVLKEIQHGILFLWRDKRLRAMAVANLLNCLLLSPIVLLMTAVGRIQLNLDASVLGLIISGGALGGLAGALLTPYIRDRLSARATMICAGGAWIAASLVLAAWPSVWGIIASWALFSLFMPVYFSTLYAYRPPCPGRTPGTCEQRLPAACSRRNPAGRTARGDIHRTIRLADDRARLRGGIPSRVHHRLGHR